MLYFAYGSNLCSEDRARWCREAGVPSLRLTKVAKAFLADRRLTFSHNSTTRGGGVLDVPASLGASVAGVVYEVGDADAIAALDRKESRGHTYRRVCALALTDDGAEQPVQIYEVEPDLRRPFVTPAAGYLDVVRRGYAEHDLPCEPLDAAARGEFHPGPIRHLFVYGTLRRGEIRHAVLTHAGLSGGVEGTVPGTLIDLGDHPGLILEGGAAGVTGETYAVVDPVTLFGALDAIETPYGYRRAIVSAGALPVWTYVYEGRRGAARTIASGDWRGRMRP